MSDGLSGQDLKAAYWYNTHRRELYRVGRLASIIVVSCIWLIFLVSLIQYIRHYQSAKIAQDTIGDTVVNYNALEDAQPLKIIESAAVVANDTTVDAYARVQNPNQHHVGRFSYTFTIQGESFHFNDGVIMPNEENYYLISGFTAIETANVDFVVDNIVWQRTRGEVAKVNFTLSDLQLFSSELSDSAATSTPTTNKNTNAFVVPTDDQAVADTIPGAPLTQLRAIVTNGSPYGFKIVRFIGVLKDTNDHIIGIQHSRLADFNSFDSRTIQFNWQRRFPFNTQAEIISLTDYWDRNNLIYPGQGNE